MASGQLPSLPDLLFILGSGMSKLSAQQLSSYTAEELKMTLKGVGRKVKMRLGLARKLVKSLLKKGEVSGSVATKHPHILFLTCLLVSLYVCVFPFCFSWILPVCGIRM
jgi:hypothetical protein